MHDISRFIDRLAEATPTPGGGGAAGLTGALAAALTQMVASLTVGRRKYQSHHPELAELVERSKRLTSELLQAIEDDAHVYKRVITVLSHRTADNETSVTQAIEDALVGAAQVPLSVVQLCGEVAEVAERLVEIGLEHAQADAAAALFLAHGAARTSLLNIKANMREVNDPKLKTSWINKGSRIVKRIGEAAARVEGKLSEEFGTPRPTKRTRSRRSRG